MTSSGGDQQQPLGAGGDCPRDAQAMVDMLKDCGVDEFEPRVVSQLLDFAYRHVSKTLERAALLSRYAEKKSIDEADVTFALEMLASKEFAQPPPKELIADLVKETNSAPLPPIKQNYGLRLPADRFCLLQPNYRLKSLEKRRLVAASLEAQAAATAGTRQSNSIRPATEFKIEPIVQESVGQKRGADEAGLDEDYDED